MGTRERGEGGALQSGARELAQESDTGPVATAPVEDAVAIAARERRLAAAFEATGDGAWHWEARTGENWISDRWSTMLGYEPGEIPPTIEGWHSLIHPEDLPGARLASQALRDPSTGLYAFEHRLRRKDGTYAWILDRARVVEWDEAGRPSRVAGIHTDVTAQHELEDLVRETSERLAEVLETATDAAWILSDGIIEWANPAMAEITGRSLEDLVGRRYVTLLDPRDHEHFLQHMASTETGLHVQVQRRLVRPDGTERWMEVHGRRLADGRWQAIGRDITVRKHVEAERDRLALALAESLDGIVLADLEGRITYANAATERITGYSFAEIEGKPLGYAAAPGYEGQRGSALETAATEGVWEADHQLTRKDGHVITTFVRVSPLTDPGGAHIGYLVTARDVTYERELEAKLAERERLESIGQLAGGVAHDFNNILTAILGHAEFAAEAAGSDPRIAPDLAEIRAAARRAQALTRQLLAFGRRAVLMPQDAWLADVAADLAPMLRRLIGEDQTLVVEPGPEVGRVHVDVAMLEHAITNLVVNARDAMVDGGTIRITTGPAEDADGIDGAAGGAGWSALRVSDEGTGIAPEVIGHIFQPFFTTKEVGKGTGLGLSMVQGFAAQSGGQVGVRSTLGEGTTVSILFPVVRAARAQDARAVPALQATARGTVLVVEDEPMLRSLARRILERAGYEVLLAQGAVDALDLLASPSNRVDLLFTDVVMPRMTGLELAARARDLRPDIALLVTSGYTDEEIDRRGLNVRTFAFLPKPYESEALLEAVAAALAG